MIPADLTPERLYMFVIGPGFGESIVVRVPPAAWLVIDSCKPGARAAALDVIDRYNGECECAVLTHRHQDHYPGFSQILDYSDWKFIGCSDLALAADDLRAQDTRPHRLNELDDVMATIVARWRERDTSQWWTWRSTKRPVGDGILTSLHPEEEMARGSPRANPNDLSTAMLLSWGDVRILLGADVENPYWNEISQEFLNLGDHAAMKVPHHGSHASRGSRGALHASFLRGERNRCWIVTPYGKSERNKRPSMNDGEGVHQLLQHVDTLHLTGLPMAHDQQALAPCVTTRANCRDGVAPQELRVGFAGALTGRALAANNGFKCYVVAEFTADGQCTNLWHGPGSIQMTE